MLTTFGSVAKGAMMSLRQQAGYLNVRAATCLVLATLFIFFSSLPISAKSAADRVLSPSSYDCVKRRSAIAEIYCNSDELQRIDLAHLIPFATLMHADGDNAARHEATFREYFGRIRSECPLHRTQDYALSVKCIGDQMAELRSYWLGTISRLNNPAATEEASLSVEQYASFQRALQDRGFLSTSVPSDGLYGAETRAAIEKFQAESQILVSGFATSTTVSRLMDPAFHQPAANEGEEKGRPSLAAELLSWSSQLTADIPHQFIEMLPNWLRGLLSLILVPLAFLGLVKAFGRVWLFLRHPIKTTAAYMNPKLDHYALESELGAKRNKEDIATAVHAVVDRLLHERDSGKAEDPASPVSVPAARRPLSSDLNIQRDKAISEIARGPSLAEAKAAELLKSGELAAAVAILERDARSDPQSGADKWRRIGDLVSEIDNSRARNAYEEAHRLEPNDFWTGVELSRLRREEGDLEAAWSAAVAADHAANDGREALVAQSVMGDVLHVGGKLPEALKKYRESVKLAQRVVDNDTKSAGAKRDLAVAYEKLGRVSEALEDLTSARKSYEASVQIFETLRNGYPKSKLAAQELMNAYSTLGDLFNKWGQLKGMTEGKKLFECALSLYNKSLLLTEELHNSDQSSSELQRAMSNYHVKIGIAFLLLGDGGSAKLHYQKNVDLDEVIARENPKSSVAKHFLAMGHNRLGDVLELLGSTDEAHAHFKKSADIAKRLAEDNSEDESFAAYAWETQERLRKFEETKLASGPR